MHAPHNLLVELFELIPYVLMVVGVAFLVLYFTRRAKGHKEEL